MITSDRTNKRHSRRCQTNHEETPFNPVLGFRKPVYLNYVANNYLSN